MTSGQILPALAVRACFNCLSNEIRSPWYTTLALCIVSGYRT